MGSRPEPPLRRVAPVTEDVPGASAILKHILLGIPLTADDVAATFPPLQVTDAFDRRVAEATSAQLPDPHTQQKRLTQQFSSWKRMNIIPTLCTTLGNDFFRQVFDPDKPGMSLAALVRLYGLVADILNAAVSRRQHRANLIVTAYRHTKTPLPDDVLSAIPAVLANTASLLGIAESLDIVEGAELLHGISTVAPIISHHPHTHEFLLHVFSRVHLKGQPAIPGTEPPFLRPLYTHGTTWTRRLTRSKHSPNASNASLRFPTPSSLHRGTRLPETSSRVVRLAKVLPQHPTVTTLIAELAGDRETYALSETASQIVSLAGFTEDVPVLRHLREVLESLLPESPAVWRCSTSSRTPSTRPTPARCAPSLSRTLARRCPCWTRHSPRTDSAGVSQRSCSLPTLLLQRPSRLTVPGDFLLVR